MGNNWKRPVRWYDRPVWWVKVLKGIAVALGLALYGLIGYLMG
jgi:hypothetical protein